MSLPLNLVLLHVLQTPDTEIHQLDSFIHISLFDFFSEMQFGQSLSQSDDGQQCSWCHIHVGLFIHSFSLILPLLNILAHNVVVEFSWNSGVE